MSRDHTARWQGGRTRGRVWEILEPPREGDTLSHVFDVALLALIVINVVALLLETMESVRRSAPDLFFWINVISVALFSVEYLLRVWACTTDPRYSSPVSGRLRWAVTPLALVDLLAVLPFYLPFLGIDLRFMRAARLLRLFRLAKLTRYSRALSVLARVVVRRKEELITSSFVLVLLLLFASSLMYFVEHRVQPQVFSSIPAAMWWAVATLTTVGYGDIYPVTPLGRMLAGVIAVLGIATFAVPTSILGASFAEELASERRPALCPHCGKPLRMQPGGVPLPEPAGSTEPGISGEH